MKLNTKPLAVRLLAFLLALMGVGAIIGGGALALAPDGHLLSLPLALLEGSPFKNYMLPGLMLLLFLGVFPLLVAYSVWRLPSWRWPDLFNPFRAIHWSWAAAMASGAIVVIWISVQMMMIGYLHPIQPFYLGWGFLIVLLCFAPGVRRYHRRPGGRLQQSGGYRIASK